VPLRPVSKLRAAASPLGISCEFSQSSSKFRAISFLTWKFGSVFENFKWLLLRRNLETEQIEKRKTISWGKKFRESLSLSKQRNFVTVEQ
jgi:hypothetical protein